MAATNVQAFSGDVEVASNLAVDTNTLLVDSVGNRVGIGTSEPIARLNIVQDFGGAGPGVPLANVVAADGSTRYGIYVGEKVADPFSQTCLRCVYDTNTVFLVDGFNKRVGIGTDSPSTRLQVNGDSAGTLGDIAYFRDSTGQPRVVIKDEQGSSPGPYIPPGVWTGSGGGLAIGSRFDAIKFYSTANGATPIERMRIVGSSGYVGIGTTIVGARLQVGDGLGPAVNTRDADASISLYGTGRKKVDPGKPGIYHRENVGLGLSSDYQMSFEVAGSSTLIDAMRIRNDGNVGIGDTNPGAKLVISSQTNVHNCFYSASINGGNGSYFSYINQRLVNFGTSPLFDIRCHEYQQNQTANGPGLQVTGREGMAMLCVKQDGQVGIGTFSNGKLRVRTQGSANIGGAPDKTQFTVSHYNSGSSIHGFFGTQGNDDASGYARLWSLRPGLSWNELYFQATNFHFQAVGGGMYFQGGLIHSDDRLKSDEEYIENALSTIMKLKPQKYKKDPYLPNDPVKEVTENMIEMKTDLRREEAGLVVQDVWYDVPELRYTIKLSDDAQPTETKPPEPVPGDPRVDPDYTTWGTQKAALDYNSVFVYNIKATQELKLKLDEIQSQITSIHTRLDALEAS